MTSACRWVGVVVACVVLIAASCAVAQDWPQWRGPNRDGKAAGFTAPQTWPKELAQKWQTKVGTGDSTPALVGGKLYVHSRLGDDEVITCLDAATGKEVWSDKYPAPAVTGAPSAHPGPRSSPAVADGKVVTLGVSGIVSCLDAASGKVLWRNDQYKGRPQFWTATSPIIVDGMGVVQLGGSGDGTIVAFDLATGNAKWKWPGDGPGYSSPVLMTVDGSKQIVAMTEKRVVGLAAADGKLLWEIAFAPAGRMAYNAATPIVDGQTVIITGSGRGAKAVKIEKEGDKFVVKDLWANKELAPQFNSPVLKDGFLFGLSQKGILYCLDAKTGKTAWTDATAHSKRGFCAIVDAGPVLLALPETSELLAFKPSGEKMEEVARIKVSATPVYATPVVAGKLIYVKDENTVTALAVD